MAILDQPPTSIESLKIQITMAGMSGKKIDPQETEFLQVTSPSRRYFFLSDRLMKMLWRADHWNLQSLQVRNLGLREL